MFRPVAILVDGEVRQLQAFIREISRNGAGFLHNAFLERGQIVVAVQDQSGSTVYVATEIVWCQPSGPDWFVSVGRFLKPDSLDVLNAQTLETRAL